MKRFLLFILLACSVDGAVYTNDMSRYWEYLGPTVLPRYASSTLRIPSDFLTKNDKALIIYGSTIQTEPREIWTYDFTKNNLFYDGAFPEENLNNSGDVSSSPDILVSTEDPLSPNEYASVYWREPNGYRLSQVKNLVGHPYALTAFQATNIFLSIGVPQIGDSVTYPSIYLTQNRGTNWTAVPGLWTNTIAAVQQSWIFTMSLTYSNKVYFLGGQTTTGMTNDKYWYAVQWDPAVSTNWIGTHRYPSNFWGTNIAMQTISYIAPLGNRLHFYNPVSGKNMVKDTLASDTPPLVEDATGGFGTYAICDIISRTTVYDSALYGVQNYITTTPLSVSKCTDSTNFLGYFSVTNPITINRYDVATNGDWFFVCNDGTGNNTNAGRVYRVRYEHITGATTNQVVNLGWNQDVVWEKAGGSYPLNLTVQRAGNTNTTLRVNYTVGGTAVAGTDYATLPGFIYITNGAYSTNITINPFTNGVGGNLTVIITLTTNGIGDYITSTRYATNKTLTIQDGDAMPWPTNGLALRFVSDTNTTADANGRVTNWVSLGDNGVAAASYQSGTNFAPLKIASGLAGRTTLRFDSNDNFPLGPTGNAYYIASVFAPSAEINSSSAAQYLYDGGSTFSYWRFGGSTVSQVYSSGGSGSLAIAASARILGLSMTNTYRAYNLRIDRTNATFTSAGQVTQIPVYGHDAKIGGTIGAGSVVGDLAELMVYNRPLSPNEETAVENWLYSQWFGSLPIASGNSPRAKGAMAW